MWNSPSTRRKSEGSCCIIGFLNLTAFVQQTTIELQSVQMRVPIGKTNSQRLLLKFAYMIPTTSCMKIIAVVTMMNQGLREYSGTVLQAKECMSFWPLSLGPKRLLHSRGRKHWKLLNPRRGTTDE